MNRYTRLAILVLAMLIVILIAFVSTDVYANFEEQDPADSTKLFDKPLCLPGLYPLDPGNCLAKGPSEVISSLFFEGFQNPIRDLPASQIDKSFGSIDALLARVNVEETLPAYIYYNLSDAVDEINPSRQIDPGYLRFVSYINRVDVEGRVYLQLRSGEWMRASPVAYTNFRGLVFSKNPANDFGWIVDETKSYLGPSFSSQQTKQTYYRTQVIQIFQTIESETVFWYRISPNEWINSLKARKVSFDPTPPNGLSIHRWISLDLSQQTMVVYEDGDIKFATLMASGLDPFFTQPGLFQIYKKLPFETMQGAFEADRSDYYYLEDVPWTMYFDQARAIHGSYWRTYFGYPQSHGCINLSPGDSNWVYQWAIEGDWVYVFDPSGKTPTNPNYYGPGAP